MAKKPIEAPAGCTVTLVEPPASKADYFIARHEASRTQFTGDTAEEAIEKLQAFLKSQE